MFLSMMKQEDVHTFFNETGGIDYVADLLSSFDIWGFIDNRLGPRHPRSKVSFGEAIKIWTLARFAGATSLEHLYQHELKFLNHPQVNKKIGPDGLSKIIKKLSVENTYYYHSNPKNLNQKSLSSNERLTDLNELKNIKHNEINLNQRLNELILDLAIFLGLIKKGSSVDIDIDSTILYNEIQDANFHYEKSAIVPRGYQPMVVMANGIPIYMEQRNGNSSPKFRIGEVLKESIELLKSRGLKVNLVRIDSAGSAKAILDYLVENNFDYVIRAANFKIENLDEIVKWNQLQDVQGYLMTSETEFKYGRHNHRTILYQRIQNKDSFKESKVKINKNNSWAIFTSLKREDPNAIISLYNYRGYVEQQFNVLKELGWKRLPHREIKHNSTFMSITMIVNLIFMLCKREISRKVDFVKETMKISSFIRQFILVVTEWRNGKYFFVTKKDKYRPLSGFV